MITALSSISLHFEDDLVAARRRARQISALLGFDEQDQTRIATVASEIARNALRYGGGGHLELAVETTGGTSALLMTVTDRGPGISNLADVLSGRYQSQTGMGIGIVGARRLMDDLQISTNAGKGTTVTMRKQLPSGAPELTSTAIANLMDELARQRPESPLEEIQQQNAELLRALAQLNERQSEQERLNQELEDTNRGVLALYAELDEKAESLRRADHVKTRFLSDMSHEFRTPVNSILALTRLLEESLHDDGKKQLGLIRRAAEDLESLVNDLLDLAKIEAGKIEVRPAEFEVGNLFSGLRGMLRPLLLNRSLSLVFEEPEGLPVMFSDEGKVSQILRNFISNALKFTEAGEVRVTAERVGDAIRFCVADTGIGIAAEDQERIFEEFMQISNPLQRNQKGTGLGLPLTRKLASILGGKVGVRSTPGAGSTFWAEIPIAYDGPGVRRPLPVIHEDKPMRILIVDDDETARYTLANFATRPGAEIFEAENGLNGIARAVSDQPDVILLDLMMPGVGGHEVLARLKSDPATARIPVIIVTSRFVNDDERKQILTRASNVVYKGDLSRDTVARAIADAMGSSGH